MADEEIIQVLLYRGTLRLKAENEFLNAQNELSKRCLDLELQEMIAKVDEAFRDFREWRMGSG